MLILSRRESESIHLGDDIVVTIVRVAGEKVRIGIQAPSHIKVLRRELELEVPMAGDDGIELESLPLLGKDVSVVPFQPAVPTIGLDRSSAPLSNSSETSSDPNADHILPLKESGQPQSIEIGKAKSVIDRMKSRQNNSAKKAA